MPSRSFTSSTLTLPLKTNVPSPSSTTVSLSTSYSSRISPTISSSRSSTVTRPGGAAVLVHHDRHLRLPALHLLQQLRHALALGHEIRRPHQRRHRRLRGRRQRDQVLDEDDPDDVVQVVAVDRHPRVLLFAEERAEILQRRIHADRDNVGTRRHDLADDRLGEVDDRLEQLASFLLRHDSLILAAQARSFRTRRISRRRVGPGVRRRLAVGRVAVAPDIDHVHERRGDRPREARERRKGRQQDVEHGFGIVSRDERRQQVLADDHEGGQRDDEHRHRPRVADVADARDQDAGGDEAAAKQQPHRDEELQGIVEVAAEAIAAPAALGHQAERQPHQRAERGLHRAEKHGGASEQEQRERGHCAALDQPFDQAAAAAKAALDASHAAVIALVIIAEQVQQAVQRQHAQLGRERMPGLARLAPGDAGGNHDVAEVSPLIGWKRQDVGWPRLSSGIGGSARARAHRARSRRSRCRGHARERSTARPGARSPKARDSSRPSSDDLDRPSADLEGAAGPRS